MATKTNSKEIEYGQGFTGDEYIKIQPEPFKAFGKTTRMNSADLSRKISAMFSAYFHDFRGTNIIPAPNGQFVVELFFSKNKEDLPKNKIKNLDNLIDNSNRNVDCFYMQQVINNRRIGKLYTLNNETKLLLSSFMFGGKDAAKPNNKKVWDNESYVKEIHIPTSNPYYRNNNMEEVLVRVTGLDIRRILQAIYGNSMITGTTRDADGNDVNHYANAHYEIRLLKMMPDGTFMVNIEQFDDEEIKKLFAKENPSMPQYTGVKMY